MPCVLLQHVEQDPSKRSAVGVGIGGDVVERCRVHDPARRRNLAFVERQQRGGALVGLRMPVRVAVLLGPGERDLLARERDAEPQAFHEGEVLQHAEKCESAGRHHTAQVVFPQPSDLAEEHCPFVLEEGREHRAPVPAPAAPSAVPAPAAPSAVPAPAASAREPRQHVLRQQLEHLDVVVELVVQEDPLNAGGQVLLQTSGRSLGRADDAVSLDVG
jgi:hypothetical protein